MRRGMFSRRGGNKHSIFRNSPLFGRNSSASEEKKLEEPMELPTVPRIEAKLFPVPGMDHPSDMNQLQSDKPKLYEPNPAYELVRNYILSMAQSTGVPIVEIIQSDPVKNYAKMLNVDLAGIRF